MTTPTPGSVGSLGSDLLLAAKLCDTTPVKRELARFTALHEEWVAAQEKVEAARAKELEARVSRGELDAEQDMAIDALARALITDGFNRISPFKTFRASSPVVLKKLGDDREAKQSLALAAAVQRHAKTSKTSRKAAQALARAADAVLAASKRVAPAALSTNVARNRRDAVLPQWMKAFSLLRLASQLSEASGGPALLSTLFARARKKPLSGKGKANLPAVPI